MLWALWLLAAAALWFFENNPGTLALLIASVVIPAASMVCAVVGARSLSVSLTAPMQSQDATFSCEVAGQWSLYGCTTDIVTDAQNLMTSESTALQLRFSAPGKRSFTLAAAHCGTIAVHVRKAVVSDWFGLLTCAVPVQAAAEWTAQPRLYPVSLTISADHAADRDEHQTLPMIGAAPDEPVGVRSYMPGDPIRSMHWKLSAKLDRPMVRETGRSADAQTLLLLETACPDDTPPTRMAVCAEALLSVAAAMQQEGLPCVIVLPEAQGGVTLLPVRAESDLDAVRQTVLRTPFGMAVESIGRRFAALYPEWTAAHTVLFSADADTDAVSLYQGKPVMLVLPPDAQMPAGPDVIVTTLAADAAYLEL